MISEQSWHFFYILVANFIEKNCDFFCLYIYRLNTLCYWKFKNKYMSFVNIAAAVLYDTVG